MINLMRFSNGFYRSLRGWRAGQGSVLLCLLALTMLCPLIVRGQELTATLSGIVTDSSGAVIPHASISIELNGVNAGARAVESDGSGNYVATNLAAGTYSITVTATGFETFKGKNIVLNVAEKHAFNVQLKAGAVSTTITVEDNPISVDTESAGQAGTITGTQIRELEIASRSFAQLVTLQPGVINAGLGVEANPQSNNQMAVNGARGSANNWTLDGADINDTGSNQTVVNTPSVDAIQEFTLQRGNYDAGYGRSGGGQVLVATKSGTSSFHGDAYEFVRNTDLDANDYFTKQNQLATGQKNQAAVNHHNAFGYTIGGPVYIPKLYNADKTKTFFFWSEEWHKIVSPNSGSEPAATTAMIGGVIPGQYTLPAWAPASEAACVAYDAKTNVTTISPTCFSQNAQVYLKDVFTPNPANDGTNYDYSFSAKNDLRDDIVRIDHYFNDKIHFFARGINDTFPTDDPLGMGWGSGSNYPGLVDTSVDSPGKNVVTVSVADPKALGDNRIVVTYAYRLGSRSKSFEQLYDEDKEIAKAHDATWDDKVTCVQKTFAADDLPAKFEIDCPTSKGRYPVYPRMLFVRREVLAPGQSPASLPSPATTPRVRSSEELATLPSPWLIGTQLPLAPLLPVGPKRLTP